MHAATRPLTHPAPLRRHSLARVSDAGWRAMLADREDLSNVPLLDTWVTSGWPLVVRRSGAHEQVSQLDHVAPGVPSDAVATPRGIALGTPLPPSAGKRRIAVTMPEQTVLSITPAPLLAELAPAAPSAWLPTLDRLAAWGDDHGVHVRIYGSLAWQWLTGLEYLTPTSDLDVLLSVPRRGDLRVAGRVLAAIDADAPMRLDGEWVDSDGAAVNWREWQTGAANVLVKTLNDVSLRDATEFPNGGMCR